MTLNFDCDLWTSDPFEIDSVMGYYHPKSSAANDKLIGERFPLLRQAGVNAQPGPAGVPQAAEAADQADRPRP